MSQLTLLQLFGQFVTHYPPEKKRGGGGAEGESQRQRRRGRACTYESCDLTHQGDDPTGAISGLAINSVVSLLGVCVCVCVCVCADLSC